MKKILCVQPIPYGMDSLRAEGEVIVASSTDPAVLEREVVGCDALIIRVTQLPENVIKASPSLKVIGRYGAGVDNIDLAAAAKCGIPVVNTPGANNIAVAEHAVALMMSLAKKVTTADGELKLNSNYQYRNSSSTTQISSKVLGLIGFGRIGQQVAQMCKHGFGMKVVVFDKYIPQAVADDFGVERVDSLDQLLAMADFVSLHAPATDETRQMINKETLLRMKKTAYLVNTSRGELINEEDLAEALNGGVIAGAAVDVFAVEPPPRNCPLYAAKNIIVTPHMAFNTEEAHIKTAEMMVDGVKAIFRNMPPEHVANKDMLAQHGF